MKSRHYAALSGIFLFFLLAGGSWVGLTRLLPDGPARALATVGVGVLFVVVFFWLLVDRIRTLLKTDERLWLQLAMVGVQVALLVVAFALMYDQLGIRDAGSGARMDSLWVATYFSIITFTTVGYGDYVPMDLARALAALQGMTGYLVLGILASMVYSLVSPHQRAGGTGRGQASQGGDGQGEAAQDEDRH